VEPKPLFHLLKKGGAKTTFSKRGKGGKSCFYFGSTFSKRGKGGKGG